MMSDLVESLFIFLFNRRALEGSIIFYIRAI